MVKKLVFMVGAGILFLASGISGVKAVSAEEKELEMRHFLYEQDFEESDPVTFWSSNAKYTVNFKGLTEEKAFSGKKSFKLDVTFKGRHYFYWKIPIPEVPAEGKLKFSARILLGEKTTAGITVLPRIGVGFRLPPSHKWASCKPFAHFGPSRDKWILVEKDIVRFGGGGRIYPWKCWELGAKNVGIYLCQISLFLSQNGKEGERAVIYLDDIKIEGDVPTEKVYKEEIKKRWAPYLQKFNDLIASWEKAAREAENTVEPDSQQEKDLMAFKKEIAEIKKKGCLTHKKYDEMDFMLKKLKKTEFDI